MKPSPLVLPFPDYRLSANSRVDRRSLTDARRTARMLGAAAVNLSGLTVLDAPLEIFIKVCPPDNRYRDDDGVISALKSYRDGIFQALHVDDKRVRLSHVGFGKVIPGGAVYIWIEPLKVLPDWMED